jgi:mRNA-degrading endonuclease RelE of RelBE toxin-antitoxin system
LKRQILWYQEAVEDILQLMVQDQKQAKRIMATIRGFGMGQRADTKKLTGSDDWRLRVGDWRVGMLLSGSIAYIAEVKNRRDAY